MFGMIGMTEIITDETELVTRITEIMIEMTVEFYRFEFS